MSSPHPETPFALLGLEPRFDVNDSDLSARYRKQQREHHPDNHSRSETKQRRQSLYRTMELNEAYRTLRDPLTRAAALIAIRGGPSPDEQRSLNDPDFLTSVMERREALQSIRQSKDVSALQRIRDCATHDRQAVLQKLAHALDVDENLHLASQLVQRLKYHDKLLDELDWTEEEFESDGPAREHR